MLFFASCRELAGCSGVDLELPEERSTTEELRLELGRRFPVLKETAREVMLAVNHEYAAGTCALKVSERRVGDGARSAILTVLCSPLCSQRREMKSH